MRNQLIRVILNKFKTGELTVEQVHSLFITLEIVKPYSIYQCESVSDKFLQMLGDNVTVIIK